MTKHGKIATLVLMLSLWSTPVWAVGVNAYMYYGPASQDGQTTQAQLVLENLEGLRAFEVKLTFDPAKVQVIDANPTQEGVQVGLGELFQDALVAVNKVDNTRGEIFVVAAKPAAEVSGSTDAIRLQLKGATPGDYKISIPNGGLKIVDKELKEKIIQGQSGQLEDPGQKPLLRAKVAQLGEITPEERTQLQGNAGQTSGAAENSSAVQGSKQTGQSQAPKADQANQKQGDVGVFASAGLEGQSSPDLNEDKTGQIITIAGAVLLVALVGYQLYRRQMRKKRRRRL